MLVDVDPSHATVCRHCRWVTFRRTLTVSARSCWRCRRVSVHLINAPSGEELGTAAEALLRNDGMSSDGARLVIALAFVGRGRQRNRFRIPSRYLILIDGREHSPAAKHPYRPKRRGKGTAKARRLLREAAERDKAKPDLTPRRRPKTMLKANELPMPTRRGPQVVLRVASAAGVVSNVAPSSHASRETRS